jgi:hypothetical protein
MKTTKALFEVTMSSTRTGEYYSARMTRRAVSNRLYAPADVRLVQNLMDATGTGKTQCSVTIGDDIYAVRLVA